MSMNDRIALHEAIAAQMLAEMPAAEPVSPEALLEAELTELVNDAMWANEQAVYCEKRGWTAFAAKYRAQENAAIEKFMTLGREARAAKAS